MTSIVVKINYSSYNTFNNMNMSSENSEDQIAKFLKALGQSVRIQIVLIIGEQEACVCHLEAILGIRQARISQHLIALRNAGIVSTRRDGRHIYYRLENPKILDLVYQTAEMLQIDAALLKASSNRIEPGCVCPRCAKEMAEC
ncbi:MAG: helix-turn-helix transcriptional regulator [Anaerolineaceae bacterium]|nr:helix-turn-helix transcriptional regulator [Anaerolineaceae bacterium]